MIATPSGAFGGLAGRKLNSREGIYFFFPLGAALAAAALFFY